MRLRMQAYVRLCLLYTLFRNRRQNLFIYRAIPMKKIVFHCFTPALQILTFIFTHNIRIVRALSYYTKYLNY